MNKPRSRKRQSGAATSIDFMLTLPLFTVFMLFLLQMALVLHAYTVVQYSAYKAARSARVQVLDGDHAFLGLDLPGWADAIASLPNASIITAAMTGLGDFGNLLEESEKLAAAAAMQQLVSISPASSVYASGVPGESWDEATQRAYYVAAGAGFSPDRTEPLMRKARYAFSGANTQVEFSFIDFQNPVLQEAEDIWIIFEQLSNTPLHSQINIPVTVTVRYRYELQIPIGQAFFANDPNHSYGRWMEATVKLM